MGKKLLSVFFLVSIFFLNSWSGFGQCPTSVSISANPGTTICAGTNVTFTANVQDNTAYNYKWYVGTSEVGNDDFSFSTTTLTNGAKVKLIVTSADATNTCSTPSNELTMTVNAVQTPTVSISTSKTAICPGESITFNATNTYGGTSPQYAWYINNSTSASKTGASVTFAASDFTPGANTVKVILTSNFNCTTSPTAEATSAQFTVREDATISDPSNDAQSVCINEAINPIQYAVGGGGTGATVTGLPTGVSGSFNSGTFTISGTPTVAGEFNYTVTTTGNCAQKTAGGKITVNPNATIALSSGSTSQTVCASGGVVSGEIAPIKYSIGATGTGATVTGLPTGISGSFSNGVFTIEGSSSTTGTHNYSVKATGTCGESAALSGSITITKNVTPAVSITSNDADNVICAGTSVTFTATPKNGGSNPVYQWKNGTTNVGTNSSTFTTSDLTDGQSVTVIMTSSETCLTTATATSNPISTTVNPNLTPEVTITSSDSDICPGDSVTFTATPVNGGSAPSFQWKIGSTNIGTNSPTFTTTELTDGQSVSVILTSNETCLTTATATSNSITTTVQAPPPATPGTITGPQEVCATATGLVYSVAAVTNAESYAWNLPTGWNITAGSGTNSITVSASSTGGNVAVAAVNSCGTSLETSLAVTSIGSVPDTPGTITSPNLSTGAICPPATGIEFNVPLISGADSYFWTLPSGWEITSGSGTNAIIVKVNSTAATTADAAVSVEAVNICGNSPKSTLSGIAVDSHVITNAGADQTVCKLIAAINIEGTYSFSGTNKNLKPTWSVGTGMGSFGNVTNLTTTFTPSQAALDAGSVVLTLTTEAPSGACGPGIDDLTIFFKPLPTATITAASPVCSGNTSTLTFTGTPNSRVTYKLPNGTNQTIDIGSSGTATFTTAALTANSTYTLVSSVNLDTPACSNTLSGSATVTITPKPTAEIIYSGAPFCTSLTTGQSPTLTGTGAYTGGTYSSTTGLSIDASSGAIVPSASTPGTYTVTYKTPAAGGCEEVIATTEVTITKEPTATISYLSTPFCTSDSDAKPVTLEGTDGFSGGTFTATPNGLTIDTNTGAITASSSTAGTYTVTYQTPEAGGCSPVPATTTVIITEVPTASISYAGAPFCHSNTTAQAVTLTGTAAFSGGVFTALPGVSIDASSGAITPASSTPGTYEITYTTPASAGCGEVTTTTSITITETPAAAISYSGPYCTSDATAHVPTFTNTVGAYQGGVFRSTPDGLSLDPSTGAINATASSPNTFTVFYELPAGEGCGTSEISTSVTITQVPQLDISYTTPLCTSDTASYPVTFSNFAGAYQGGTFTATSGLAIDSAGNIIAANSTPGIHTVTYTTPEGNGCGPIAVTTNVEIFKEVVITTPPVNVGICSTEPASFEVVASGDNLTYEWKRVDGTAITNATGTNTAKLSFSNATATNAGEYYVQISGSSPCSPVSSDPVTLNVDENIVIIKPTEDISFCDQEREGVTFEFIAHANGAPLEFTWIKDGADIPNVNTDRYTFVTNGPSTNGEYNGTMTISGPNPADNGVYAVRISGPDYFTCSDATSKTFTLNVTPLPEPPVTADIVYCQNAAASPLTATGENGATFTWYDANNVKIDGVPTPSTSEPGTFVYFVTQTTAVCESNPSELTVTVKPTPAAPTTSQSVAFCYNEVVTTPLTATVSNTGSTLNWYGPDDSNTALTSAPTPATSITGIVKYWVSETFEGCESPLVEIVVTVNPLPTITATADPAVICEGSTTTLRATGGISYEWFIGETSVGTGAEFPVSPMATTTYTVVGTNNNGCKNSTQITIEVDEPTVIGTLQAPTSVCANNPNGTLTLSGYTGDIMKWETKPATGTTWTVLNGNTNSTIDFTGLTVNTDYRVTVKNGVCAEATAETRIIIDPLPLGGELNFAGNGRVFTICENPVGNYAVDLNLTGTVGEVVRWGYRNWDATGYTTLNIGGEVFTGNTLTAAQIQSLGFNQTTVFQVEVRSGVCSPDALSKTAILSVIPSNITPSPVTVNPGVVCLGEEVTLSSETGYESGGTILDQGAFDNASITNHGWRIRREGITGDLGFDTDANNTEFDRWKRATPRAFTTASINSPYNTSGVVFDTGIEDGNKGFALISGNYRSTMETPVFTIGSTDQAILTFDQAYVLTPGASLKVEISTDGGNTYTTLYIREVPATATQGIASGNTSSFGTGTIDSHPENKILIDLGDYMGRPNLRIRFNYSGTRSGDIWAVDNIDIPEGPHGITMEWRDYTDSTNPEGVLIGTSNTEKWTPKQIGLNIFEVKTKLVFNSNGDACETAENAQRVEVFVFDKYTTTTTAVAGSCGNLTAQLSATVTNATGTVFTSFPTPDGYVGEWKIESTTGYSLIDSNPDDGIAAINDPNAILSANEIGTFKASFVLKPTLKNAAGVLYENKNCLPTAATQDVVFQPCTTLDFDGVDDFVDLGEGYTGDYSIEAWIRPEAATGTIISTPQLEINMADLPGVTPNTRWYHIAVDSDGLLYIDGIASGTTISKTGSTRAFIGARWNSPNPENFFSGWIEEVRIWNGKISEKNIRFTMNQRLKATGNIGVEVDMAHPDAPVFGSLVGYYQLIATNILNGGYTLDLATNAVNGKLRNMTTTQENTAPLPYTSKADGNWTNRNTWTQPVVWDYPNSTGINGETIDWNIVKTSHNIQSGARNINILGLLSQVNTLTIEGTNPPDWNSSGTGNALYISHYLSLNGIIDLSGESQLIQPNGSIVDAGSTGYLERDQQGTASSYNYNYWSSPVSPSTGNADYTVAGIMRDGTNPAEPKILAFGDPYTHADGGFTTPKSISNYWINKFRGNANVYGEWQRIGSSGNLNVGEGYTMKGTSGHAAIKDPQNYVFVGKPNNGTIALEVGQQQNYLLGNPYPSAISVEEFLMDNLKNVGTAPGRNEQNIFNGAIYFWDHFSGKTHILKEYVGGYATRNLLAGVPAASTDERINYESVDNGEKIPGPYIPVGQGFFINTAIDEDLSSLTPAGGNVLFKNNQREFVPDANGSSGAAVFLRPENHTKTSKTAKADTRAKIRLLYKSPLGYQRQILVGVDPNASNGFDLGYDALLNDNNVEDMYWVQENNWLVIQGVSHFDKDQQLPLGVKLKDQGEFTIEIHKLENFPDDKNVYIKDILNDSIHNLRKEPFKATAEGGYINDRFEIVFFKEETSADEPPVVDKPSPDIPVEEIPGGEWAEFKELTVRHSHTRREIQILNPDQLPLSNMYIFDINGNQIEHYRNLSHDKVVVLPVRNFATGAYIIKLYSEGRVINRKIIISN